MPISYLLAKNTSLKNLLGFFITVIVRFLRLRRFLSRDVGTGIVVISLHKLGDSVFTIPAIKEILKHLKTDIYLFCFEETKPIFKMSLREDQIISFKHSDFYLDDRVAKHSVRKKIVELNPRMIYDLTGSIRSATILIPSTVKEIIGMNESYFKPIYTKFVPRRAKPHIIDIYLDIVDSIIDTDRKILKEFPVRIIETGYLLIHPFAGWTAKEWNLHKFIKLAENLNQHFEVIIVSPSGKITEDVANELISSGVKWIETKDSDELIDIIRGCSILISNDSGPIYIANFMGKPTFTIYGPTNPVYHLPFGKNHQFYQTVIKCSPDKNSKYCFTDAGRNGCPSFECMNMITVSDLENKLLDFIEMLGIKHKVYRYEQ